MINPANNTTVWYCSVKEDKVHDVIKNGLQCFSDPISSLISYRAPWIIVTTEPEEGGTVCKVDLADIAEHDVKWVFVPKGSRKRLRVFEDIPADKVSILKETDHRA